MLALIFSPPANALSQSIVWPKTQYWTLYEVKNKKDFVLPADSLKYLPKLQLNPDSVNFYLEKAEILPKDKYSLWMGRFLCSYQTGQGIHKVYISVYGGFFFDDTSKRYYQIPLNNIDEWLAFWNRSYSQFNPLPN